MRVTNKAVKLGITLAKCLRGLLSRGLNVAERAVDPSAVVDLGNSGGADIARDKDWLAGEAVAARDRLRRG